jgi:hypothetical protein
MTGDAAREQRLIEIIIGPCTRGHAEPVLEAVQEFMDQSWSNEGAAVRLHTPRANGEPLVSDEHPELDRAGVEAAQIAMVRGVNWKPRHVRRMAERAVAAYLRVASPPTTREVRKG